MSRTNGAVEREGLILGIDIGSTSSAVSIAHLLPGIMKPAVHTVGSWPSQPLDSKIPSVVAFAPNGRTVCGAEVFLPSTQEHILQGRMHVCDLFKLHLHPQSLNWEVGATFGALALTSSALHTPRIVPSFSVPSLPPGVLIDQVYSTFIAYLVKHAQKWFEGNILGGEGIWKRYSSNMEIIMGIPDGWDEHQCEVLKKAIVASGVIETKEEADKRVDFLRESEASVHFALESNDVKEWMKAGVEFTVADLGGSTCDTCMYHVDSVFPKLVLREVKPSDSVQAGGIFVDRAAASLLKAKLATSRFDAPATLKTILSIFEKHAKRLYRGGSQTTIIKFGDLDDTDLTAGIRSGRLMLSSEEVAQCFDFCKTEIIASVKSQIKMGSRVSKVVVMTGGFGDNTYLYDELSSALRSFGIPVLQLSSDGRKPVAEGLVLWKLKQIVAARAVRHTYGGECLALLSSYPSGYIGRPQVTLPDGLVYIRGRWRTTVEKGTVMETDQSWSSRFCLQFDSHSKMVQRLRMFRAEVIEYTGDEADPDWCDDEEGSMLDGFEPRCTVEADLSNVSIETHVNDFGQVYWKVPFKVLIFVAQTTLKAKLVWKDTDGNKCEGAAELVFSTSSSDVADEKSLKRRKPVWNC